MQNAYDRHPEDRHDGQVDLKTRSVTGYVTPSSCAICSKPLTGQAD